MSSLPGIAPTVALTQEQIQETLVLQMRLKQVCVVCSLYRVCVHSSVVVWHNCVLQDSALVHHIGVRIVMRGPLYACTQYSSMHVSVLQVLFQHISYG
jgi:hypothetical protein